MMKMNSLNNISAMRPLKWWEIQQLEAQGCSSADWTYLRISDSTPLYKIRNVMFKGNVSLANIKSIYNATLHNVDVEDDVVIENVPGGISDARIRHGAVIENCARIVFEPEAPCGVGIRIDVLDETGARPVIAYPGLSAQMAMLQTRKPKWAARHLAPLLSAYIDSLHPSHEIGEHAVVRDCGPILNVFIDREVIVDNVATLKNGSVINNAASGRPLAYVGSGVNAHNFIFEDARVDNGAIVRNCYVGQGASLDKGFTAHDSLFFANSACENGEACAFFAGPYTVSMHKASLLIGCVASFMNAGSASNQSNHMYKMGPVHWGILERGVKTSSNSYLMLGANIGAFSLLMGSHKTHPDSTSFPFSYLFGDERGSTVVVPAQMLRSCGLMRDEKKWPARDLRLKRKLPLHDRIHFDVLTPFTVDRMLKAIPIIDGLLTGEPDDDRFLRWKGMKFSRASLERAKHLYTIAIYKYISLNAPDFGISESEEISSLKNEAIDEKDVEWIDLAGQIMPRSSLGKVLEAESIPAMEAALTDAYEHYQLLQKEWIEHRFDAQWRKHPEVIREYAAMFDAQVEQDRADYLAQLAAETDSLAL